MTTPPMFKIGDAVECVMNTDSQNAHRKSDAAKAKKLGKKGQFIGNVAAYMHTDEAYLVTGITDTGGVTLRGFCGTVSQYELRLSTKKVIR